MEIPGGEKSNTALKTKNINIKKICEFPGNMLLIL